MHGSGQHEPLGFTEVVETVEVPEVGVRTAEGTRIELIERAGSARPATFADPMDALRAQGCGHWAVEVDDLDAAYARLTGAGAQRVWPPADAVQASARFAYVKDPEDNVIELIQPAA